MKRITELVNEKLEQWDRHAYINCYVLYHSKGVQPVEVVYPTGVHKMRFMHGTGTFDYLEITPEAFEQIKAKSANEKAQDEYEEKHERCYDCGRTFENCICR
jgi:hypothetical protein